MSLFGHSPLRRGATVGILVGGLALGISVAGAAQPDVTQDIERKRGDADLVLTSAGFLAAHPDLRWRLEALDRYDRGQKASAAEYFRSAARYADKPSQALLAEMLWTGDGIAEDRPLAYAFMDLASERRWKWLVVRREAMWAALNTTERDAAVERGQMLWDEFRDEIAKPRTELKMRQARRQMTGSRTGFVGALTIQMPNSSGPLTISGDQYYADQYWEPGEYWAWSNETWSAPPTPRVDIGPLRKRDGEPPPDEN